MAVYNSSMPNYHILETNKSSSQINWQKAITSWQIDKDEMETVIDFIFLGFKITVDHDCHHEIKRHLLLERKAMINLESILKKQRYNFADKSPYNQSSGFSSSHKRMWELDDKEGRAPKNWCFQTVALEKTLQSSLDSKEIKSVNTKGNQSWIFIGSTDANAEAPILWPPDAKNDLLEKSLMLGKIEGRRTSGRQRMRLVHSITHSMDINLSKLHWIVKDSTAWHAAIHGIAKSQTQLSDWIITTISILGLHWWLKC